MLLFVWILDGHFTHIIFLGRLYVRLFSHEFEIMIFFLISSTDQEYFQFPKACISCLSTLLDTNCLLLFNSLYT